MIKIITPGFSKHRYTNTCPECMCVYEYGEEDVLHSYDLTTNVNPYIMCPYCGCRNNIYSFIPYNPIKKEPYEWWKVTCYCDRAETKDDITSLKGADIQDEQD